MCGRHLISGLTDGARLPKALFTPTIKAESGHDLPLSRSHTRR
ncbi:MAG: phosphoribosylaminoimidazolesuccinocarboxamide synthase [Patescibacteria group bacterium]